MYIDLKWSIAKETRTTIHVYDRTIKLKLLYIMQNWSKTNHPIMSFIAIATFGENACVWYPPVKEICNLQSLNHYPSFTILS